MNGFYKKPGTNAFKITLLYIVFGGLWIFLSDYFLDIITQGSSLTTWQTFKGWFYIIITGLMLYFLIKRSEISLWEKSLEQIISETKFRKAIEHFSGVCILYDPDRSIRYINKTGVVFSRRTYDELIGKRDEDIFPSEVTDSYLSYLISSIENKEVKRFETMITLFDKKYYLIIEYIPLLDENQKLTNILSLTHDISTRKKYEESLLKSRKELQQLNEYLTTAREDERAAVARDIHDHLGQILTGIKIDLSLFSKKNKNNPDSISRIDQLMKDVNESISITRRITEELRPPTLDDLGVLLTIQNYVIEFEQRSGIKCTFSSNLGEKKLDNKLSINLFRVIQEALTNILKHSKATNVNIEMLVKNDRLYIMITDNGTGIKQPNDKAIKNFGIIGMRERLNLVNGTFNIQSDEGKGTTILAEIPLNKPGSEVD